MHLRPTSARLASPLLAALLILAIACGEPPMKQDAPSPAPAETTAVAPAAAAPSPAATPADAATTTTAGADALTTASSTGGSISFSEPPQDRSKLPADAPAGAMVVTGAELGKRGGKLVTAEASGPKTYNPLLLSSVGDQAVAGLHFSGLYGYDLNEQREEAGLAHSWSYDAPTRTWTFHLREGLTWSDGAPLTSDDFLFYSQVLFDPNVPNDDHFYFRAEAKKDAAPYVFAAPDPLTLTVTIPVEDSFAFQMLGLVRPLPRHKLGQAWKDGKFVEMWGAGTKPEELVSCGPYKLKEYREGESMIFERNPRYWAYDAAGTQLPYIDELYMLLVEDTEAMEIRFLAGELDLIEGNIKPDNLARFKDDAAKGNFTVFPLGASLNPNNYWFNINQGGTYTGADGKQATWQPSAPGEAPPATLKDFKPFVDPIKRAWFEQAEFRIACSQATNRQRMIDTVLFGEGAPLYGSEAPANKRWSNPDIPKFPYDVEAAKARLDKLGFIDRDKDGVREDAKGNPIRFTIVSNRENNIREKVAQLLQEDLQAVGLGARVQMLEFRNLITRLKDTYDYEACLLGAGTGIPPHPAMAANTWQSTGDMRNWYPEQPMPMTPWEAQLDTMYTSLKRTFDIAEQQRIFFEMQRIYCEQQPQIYLFTSNVYVAAKNKIGNLKPSILRGSLLHNLDELYIKE